MLAIDFKRAYEEMRERVGRHFSRVEFYRRAQDRTSLTAILTGDEGSDILRWIAHAKMDAAEVEAYERFCERIEEEAKAHYLALQQRMKLGGLEFACERFVGTGDPVADERKREELREGEEQLFELLGIDALPKVKHGVDFFVDNCPLLGCANVAADCEKYAWTFGSCVFFEEQSNYFVGCSARRNGVG